MNPKDTDCEIVEIKVSDEYVRFYKQYIDSLTAQDMRKRMWAEMGIPAEYLAYEPKKYVPKTRWTALEFDHE